MLRRILTTTGVLAAVGATAMCTGTNPEEVALAGASAEARDSAEHDRLAVERRLRESPPADGGGARADTVALLGPDKVFDSRTDPEGFEVDGVFYGRRDAGGGWSAAQVSVRMCVRFTARLSGAASVALTDVDCPSTLPTTVPHYGTVTRTVRLAD
jgi:hypothetical protein